MTDAAKQQNAPESNSSLKIALGTLVLIPVLAAILGFLDGKTIDLWPGLARVVFGVVVLLGLIVLVSVFVCMYRVDQQMEGDQDDARAHLYQADMCLIFFLIFLAMAIAIDKFWL